LADNEENSVSYLSIAFTCKQSWSQIAAEKRANIVAHLSEEEKSTLLKIARATLEFYVATGPCA
jgi:hypothetical protein